jgi:hypothetical protein
MLRCFCAIVSVKGGANSSSGEEHGCHTQGNSIPFQDAPLLDRLTGQV